MVGICALLLNGLGSTLVTNGEQPTQSGNFVSSFSDRPFGTSFGNGTYTVSYLFPSVVSLGSNFTTQVSLQVNELTELQLYVEQYQITVRVNVPNGQGASGTVGGSTPLYPGAIWGPKNITIPITQLMTGPFAGSLNASVSITLATTVSVGYPVLQDHVHTASQLAGNLAIEANASGSKSAEGNLNPQSGFGYLPYLIVGAGVIVVSVGVFLPQLFPEKHRDDE